VLQLYTEQLLNELQETCAAEQQIRDMEYTRGVWVAHGPTTRRDVEVGVEDVFRARDKFNHYCKVIRK
jgi:hypothetical protein